MLKSAIHIIVLTLVMGVAAESLRAQSAEDARVRLSHPGVDVLKADLQKILDLTDKAEQRQWQNMADFIDTFVYGVDYGNPLHVEILIGVDPISYLLMLPLEDGFQTFRENIEGLGYELRRDADESSLYQFNMQFDSGAPAEGEDEGLEDLGWIRVTKDPSYMLGLLTYKKSTLSQLRDFVLKSAVPNDSPETGLSAELENTEHGADSVASRRESVQAFRSARIEAIMQRPDETENSWQLRKLVTRHLMDELERVLAESAKVKLHADLNGTDDAKLEFNGDLVAIQDTRLDKAVGEFNAQPSIFAGIRKPSDSALSLRVNHPVDEMRMAAALELVELVQGQLKERLEAGDRSQKEKTAVGRVLEKAAEHLNAGIRGGWLNLFVESVPTSGGKFTTVAGYRSPATAAVSELLPELAEIGSGAEVEMNVATAGNTAIHRVRLGSGISETLDRLLSESEDAFVGVAEDRIWLATGEGALKQLQDAIAAAKTEEEESCLHLEVRMLPWTEQLIRFYGGKEAPEDFEELNAFKAAERRRARAAEAYGQGADTVVFDAHVKDGHVLSSLILNTGIVRFIGKEMASFSKENLAVE